jgi:hypothetical protein
MPTICEIGSTQYWHVIRRHLAPGSGAPGAEQEIAMGQHHALRRAGGTRRVNENRDLPCTVGLDRLGRRILVQRGHTDATKRADILNGCIIARGMGSRFRRHIRGQKDADENDALRPLQRIEHLACRGPGNEEVADEPGADVVDVARELGHNFFGGRADAWTNAASSHQNDREIAQQAADSSRKKPGASPHCRLQKLHNFQLASAEGS